MTTALSRSREFRFKHGLDSRLRLPAEPGSLIAQDRNLAFHHFSFLKFSALLCYPPLYSSQTKASRKSPLLSIRFPPSAMMMQDEDALSELYKLDFESMTSRKESLSDDSGHKGDQELTKSYCLSELTDSINNWHLMSDKKFPFEFDEHVELGEPNELGEHSEHVERGEFGEHVESCTSSSSSTPETWARTTVRTYEVPSTTVRTYEVPSTTVRTYEEPAFSQRNLPVLRQSLWKTSENLNSNYENSNSNFQNLNLNSNYLSLNSAVNLNASYTFGSQPTTPNSTLGNFFGHSTPTSGNGRGFLLPSPLSFSEEKTKNSVFRAADVSRAGRQARPGSGPGAGPDSTAARAALSASVAVWSGTLPPRNANKSAFSCKVFLGGVPWDITEKDLMNAFGHFGSLRIEWPGIHDKQRTRMPKGHLYLIFDHEDSIKYLLGACSYDCHHGQHNWFFKVASKRMLVKSVQVIPWQLADASFLHPGAVPSSGVRKIFVANLHGMITAEGLARIMNDLFGGVIAATLDTDKTKYPIGSGRITFNNHESHMKAIRAGTVDIRTAKFSRQIKIDPYLEDSACSVCQMNVGPFFCRDLGCFSYFCGECWQWQHGGEGYMHHQPMVRPARALFGEEEAQ